MQVLALNCGSSSVKYKLFDLEKDEVLARGLAERIGLPGARVIHAAGRGKEFVFTVPLSGHQEALALIFRLLADGNSPAPVKLSEIRAVGHRVVHGGQNFQRPVAVDERVLSLLEESSKFAPLHNPYNIMGIKACRALLPGALQVAVFDTAFHRTIPDYAFMYAVPYAYYEHFGLRKYGFHGISYQYVSQRAAEFLGRKKEDLKMIICHLGNGASLCALKGGVSVDTTMGFTPLAGTVMSTRCGDVDPGVVLFLAERDNLSPAGVLEILNKRSGVFGISGLSGDFRDLEEAAGKGHPRASLALKMFIYSLTKHLGAFIAALGGLDVLVFTAGIGENSPAIRAAVCANLKFAGVFLDEEKNRVRGKEAEISAETSAVRVLVIPTDEEKMIAEEAGALTKKHARL
ncbi:MAG: acetate/propionate family kinase [Desulfotomaculales bacterium]